MTGGLTREEVSKVALLGRLKLSADEMDRMTVQLSRVLEYVDILNEVETKCVEPMAHAIELRDVFREDVPVPSLSREDALANAPKSDRRCFVVPAIFE